MDLVLDFGNSFVKAGLFEGDRLQQVKRFKAADDEALRAFIGNEGIDTGIFASVTYLSTALHAYLQEELGLLELTQQSPLPIELAYATPETLGIDRIAAVVGANRVQPGQPSLAIETGTCITYDLITADGVYHGGAISPGFQMRFQALHAFTGKLPLVDGGNEDTFDLTGNDTQGSMLSGVCNGIIFEVDGFISSYRDQYPDLAVVLGGGDTGFFEKHLKNPIFAQPNLVLLGLHEILKYNAAK